MTLLLLLLRLLSPSWDEQHPATVPSLDQADLVTLSGAEESGGRTSEQCPTCSTIDLAGGKQTWFKPKSS